MQPGDLFVILASRGIWDVISSEEACREICLGRIGGRDGAVTLCELAAARGCRDVLTCVVVHFDWSVNPPQGYVPKPEYSIIPTSKSGRKIFGKQKSNGFPKLEKKDRYVNGLTHHFDLCPHSFHQSDNPRTHAHAVGCTSTRTSKYLYKLIEGEGERRRRPWLYDGWRFSIPEPAT